MAITTAWTAIAASQTDADSPLDQTLFDSIRGDVYHNYDWIGLAYTPSDNHAHNGVDSALIATGGLKATTSEVSVTDAGGTRVYPTNTGYSFVPQFKDNNAASGHDRAFVIGYGSLPDGDPFSASTTPFGTTYKLVAVLSAHYSTLTAYLRFTYIQASPPYRFGDIEDFGEFIFLRRKRSDGTIVAASCAPDPVWEGDWSPLPKGHPARIAMVPHPFADGCAKDEEIVLCDLRHLNVEERLRPHALAHAHLLGRRSEFVALGIDAQEIARYEDEAQQRKAAELAAHVAAEQAHDKLMGQRERLIAEAPERMDMQAGVIDMSKPKPRFTKAGAAAYVDARCRVLRKQAGYVTKIEAIKAQAAAQGSSLLTWVNDGKLPDAIVEHEIPEKHRLPKVEAFAKNVRVLKAAKV